MTLTADASLNDLACEISGLACKVSQFLRENDLPAPSFRAGVPAGFPTAAPPDVQAARQRLLQLTQDLHNLVLGPEDRVRADATDYANAATLRWIQHFKIARCLPRDGSVTYRELAASAAVPQDHLKRILRYTMLNGYFSETCSGEVEHSAKSLLLLGGPLLDYVDHAIEFSYPVMTKMVEMTEKYKGSESVTETALNIMYDTPLPMFAYLKQRPEDYERFGRLMSALKGAPPYSVQNLVSGYDWAALGSGNIVDVGGNMGQTSFAIAERFPDLKFVVQDRPEIVELGKANAPKAAHVKLGLMAHDFFELQPVSDADLYLLRQIMHDWPDGEAKKILKNIVVSMKAGAKILVMDQIVPPPGLLSNAQERASRLIDLVVLSHCNGKQRDMEDWKKLFASVDERLTITKVTTPPGSVLSILELSLADEPVSPEPVRATEDGSVGIEMLVNKISHETVAIDSKALEGKALMETAPPPEVHAAVKAQQATVI